MRGFLHTSVFIGREQDRPLAALPDKGAISVMALAQPHVGVLVAVDDVTRSQRLRPLAEVERSF